MGKIDDKADIVGSHASPVLRKDRMTGIAEEQETGGHFEGESLRERMVGIEHEVVVDIFKRTHGAAAGTFYCRVSIRSQIRRNKIYRADIDLDKYTSERDFLAVVEAAGGALAEQDNEYGANWSPTNVAKLARQSASEIMREINDQG